MRLKVALTWLYCLATVGCHFAARAQAGPPFLTNDPGTPGNANWEINLGTMPTIARGASSYQVPQIDLNYGLGDRIQLTYEVPYIFQYSNGQSKQSGWSNGYPGVKWRFVDGGEDGWQISTFPQIETGVSAMSQRQGIGAAGPRYLLPIEVAKKLGPLDFDIEAGYYLPVHGPREQIFGFVTGRSITERLELDAEIYDDRAYRSLPNNLTLDIGGRYKLSRGFIALFMLGRSLNGFSSGQPEFLGYVGIQILLSDYGRTLTSEP
jgi:hypothetical protein